MAASEDDFVLDARIASLAIAGALMSSTYSVQATIASHSLEHNFKLIFFHGPFGSKISFVSS